MKPAMRNALSRRNFILAAGAGGAAAAAVLVSRQQRGKSGAALQKKTENSVGYHVTEHIRKYYNTTKV